MAYTKNEHFDEKVTAGLVKSYGEAIKLLGEDPNREGLEKTPERVAKAMQYMMQGYGMDACAILDSAKFHEPISEMIVVKDIELYSMCEHHMLPFFGKAHVAYIPHHKIVGLSKLNRIVNYFSRRPQVQERLTQQVAQSLLEHLQPKAVGVILRCRHMCMESRGIAVAGEETVTSAMLGDLKTNAAQRAEFMALAEPHE